MRFSALLLVSVLACNGLPVFAAEAPANVTVFGDVPTLPSADPRPTPQQNYQIYMPREFKSDEPQLTRTWSPSGYPNAGNQLTPFGLECTTSNDCQPPLVCIKRADSGQLAVKQCAFAPGN